MPTGPHDPLDSGINIRSRRYFIALATQACPHCRSSTPLLALGVPSSHEMLVPDDDVPDAGANDTWTVMECSALLFHIDYLPASVERRVAQFTATFHDDAGREDAGGGWTNHCADCDRVLDDHDLFCEPEGAFLPADSGAARRIHLVSIEEAFEASVAGYAYEPEFYHFMRRD